MPPKLYSSHILSQRHPFILLLALLLCCTGAYSQPPVNHLEDSLKKNLSQAQTDTEKNNWLMELAKYYVHTDPERSDKYAGQAIQVAELSRDRKMIANTYIQNGIRYGSRAELDNYTQFALDNFREAEKVARVNGLDDELAYSYIGESRVFRIMGDYDKCLNYDNLALAIAAAGNNDSLKVSAYNSTGIVYTVKNEKLLALRNFLQAMNVAELSKKESLLIIGYSKLSDFYADIEDYDKAIDYTMKALRIDQRNHDRYKLLNDYNAAGALFTGKKQYDVALIMYESAIALADSLDYSAYKIQGYLNFTNMYLSGDQIKKGLEYLDSHQEVLDFFKKSHLGFFLDEGYGVIYSEMGKYDSAAYFFKKSQPEIELHANKFMLYSFYIQYGRYFQKTGNYTEAITWFSKAKALGDAIKDLNILQTSTQYLDSTYTLKGDFKNAYHYNGLANKYRDSSKTLAKETDLLKLEVDADNKRRDRLAKEEEVNTQHRHNVQYMGITAGIASLFIVMVMMGFFVVSPRTIRALGFFSFIFLFEFIILLADKQIHEWTNGEPWKILIIKIALAAVLLPLHHWLEHKVIHYLTTRKKLVPNSFFAAGRQVKPTEAAPAQQG